MTERSTEEEAVRQTDEGTKYIGSVAGRDVELPDHVQRALHGPEPRHIVMAPAISPRLGMGGGSPPLREVYMPPVYPGGWQAE